MNQNWFEMSEIRRKFFSKSVWVTLRASQNITEIGEYGQLGYSSEYFGMETLAIPVSNREEAKKLGWTDLALSSHHYRYNQDEEYIHAATYCFNNNSFGEHLILEQTINSLENKIWHLNQDLVITLGLMQEGDFWILPAEGYKKIVQLHRNEQGAPCRIDILSSHLRDYLCVRKMALFMTSFRNRIEIVINASHITWPKNPYCMNTETDRWKGRVDTIHEGGMGFGEKIAVSHLARTDENLQDDVPELESLSEENSKSNFWVKKATGKKLYWIDSKLWRNEWLEPSAISPLVRCDKTPAKVFFITSIDGQEENKETLINSDKWLWFRPDVVGNLMCYRGSELKWDSRNTGNIRCSPDYNVHFGINGVGLINVFARDIGQLPDWQQKIWAGNNVNPDGGVSSELLDSQMRCNPVNTLAPEEYLEKGLRLINVISEREFRASLLKQHKDIPALLKKAHRFRVTDESGLYALAKDLTRLVIEPIDSSVLKKFITLKKDEKLGSLKLLEKLIAINNSEKARSVLTPLVGVNKLRHADTHLPSNEIDTALQLVKVNKDDIFLNQGYQLLHSCVLSIYEICSSLKGINKKLK